MKNMGSDRRADRKLALGFPILLGLLLLVPAAGTLAATASPADLADAPAAAKQASAPIPLAQFNPAVGPIRLAHSRGRYTLTIPVGDRLAPKDGLLDISFTNSISLLEKRSQIRFYWDGQLLAQLPLRPQQPEGRVTIRLPKELLTGGYHQLFMEANQHYTDECEDALAPELWTEIDTVKSTLTLPADFKPLSGSPLKLGDLGKLIDPKLAGGAPIRFVATLPAEGARLDWLSQAAQGVALRLRYAPLLASVGDSLAPAGDQIAVGTRKELAGLLGGSLSGNAVLTGQGQGQGATLAIAPLPGDPRYFLLLVTGDTDQEVSDAAATFARGDLSLVPSPVLAVGSVSLPDLSALTQRGHAEPGQSYLFSHFGFDTATLAGYQAGDASLSIQLPADFYAPEEAQVILHLNFAYNAGMRSDSSAAVYLNGRFQQAIPIKNPDGGSYRDYRVLIPLRSFAGGTNKISIAPSMLPQVSGHCIVNIEDKFIFVVGDDSIISFPSAERLATMPDLHLFSDAGFPLLAAPSVWLSHGGDAETLGAALTVLAKLAQKAGEPLAFRFVASPDDAPGNLLAIAPAGAIDPKLVRGGPWVPGGNDAAFALPVAASYSQGSAQEGKASLPAHPAVVLKGVFPQSDSGLLVEYERPGHSGSSVVLITARDAATLLDRAHQLAKPERWETLRNDTAVWDGTDLRTQRTSASYLVGTKNPAVRFHSFFSNHMAVLISTVAALLVAFALLTRRVLHYVRRKNHGEGT